MCGVCCVYFRLRVEGRLRAVCIDTAYTQCVSRRQRGPKRHPSVKETEDCAAEEGGDQIADRKRERKTAPYRLKSGMVG